MHYQMEAKWDALIGQLNAGEVISDEDLEGINLKDERGNWISTLSKIIVASAGKPGQGILTRVYPNFFQRFGFDIFSPGISSIKLNIYELFPAKGKFNFEKAVTSLLGLLSELPSDYSPYIGDLRVPFLQIYFGFWLYHGTDTMYNRLWSSGVEQIGRLQNFNATVNLFNEMYWAATEEQWNRFKTYNNATFNLRVPIISASNKFIPVFAPIYILKETIKEMTKRSATETIRYYSSMLKTFLKLEQVYLPGKTGPQPKGSIKPLVNATAGMIEWGRYVSGYERNKIWKIFRLILKGLKEANELNAINLNWLSKTELIKKIDTLTPVILPQDVEVSTTLTQNVKVSTTFLGILTPGIWEKVDESLKEILKDPIEAIQKDTKSKLTGTVLAMHGQFTNDVLPEIIGMSLPWERVWIGVGGKREYGKMYENVESYIRSKLKSIEKTKEDRKEKVDQRKNKKVRVGACVDQQNLIAKLKNFFQIKVVDDSYDKQLHLRE